MASKLLIYIGESEGFDVDGVRRTMVSMPGWNTQSCGPDIGACQEYLCARIPTHELIVRVSPDAETVTIDGDFDASLDFALAFQAGLPTPLRMIDMSYSFDVALSEIGSVNELRSAVAS